MVSIDALILGCNHYLLLLQNRKQSLTVKNIVRPIQPNSLNTNTVTLAENFIETAFQQRCHLNCNILIHKLKHLTNTTNIDCSTVYINEFNFDII